MTSTMIRGLALLFALVSPGMASARLIQTEVRIGTVAVEEGDAGACRFRRNGLVETPGQIDAYAVADMRSYIASHGGPAGVTTLPHMLVTGAADLRYTCVAQLLGVLARTGMMEVEIQSGNAVQPALLTLALDVEGNDIVPTRHVVEVGRDRLTLDSRDISRQALQAAALDMPAEEMLSFTSVLVPTADARLADVHNAAMSVHAGIGTIAIIGCIGPGTTRFAALQRLSPRVPACAR